MDSVNVTKNFAGHKGGGLYVDRGHVFLRSATVLDGNTVRQLRCEGDSCGATYYIATPASQETATGVFYALPTPPASYLSLTSDCRDEVIRAFPGLCAPKYQTHAELRNAIVTELVAHRFDGTFPLPCPAGVFGRAGQVEEQRTNGCSGPCPAGHECATQCSKPLPCPPGTFCPLGSTRPEQCSGGTVCLLYLTSGFALIPRGKHSRFGTRVISLSCVTVLWDLKASIRQGLPPGARWLLQQPRQR